MHPAIAVLMHRRAELATADWHDLWDRVRHDRLPRDEVVLMLASLSGGLPGHDTLRAMLTSLAERRPGPAAPWPGSVNVVGTGGGPATFNISTAAAFTAAAVGVPVVKTGSRAYTSRLGSVDLLDRLGIRLSPSAARTAEALAEYGIAFPGPYVYPTELTSLARRVTPLSLKPFGRFLNTVGPFLASSPVTAQVTGISDASTLPALRVLAEATPGRRIWLCVNDEGADELLPFAENQVHATGRAEPETVRPGGDGSLADLRPGDDPVETFLGVVSGAGHPTATAAVALNAAALARASGQPGDWAQAAARAGHALREGAVRDLVERLRTPAHPLAGAGRG